MLSELRLSYAYALLSFLGVYVSNYNYSYTFYNVVCLT